MDAICALRPKECYSDGVQGVRSRVELIVSPACAICHEGAIFAEGIVTECDCAI